MEKDYDGFDRFVDWVYDHIPWLRWFKPLYVRYKEFWLYALFGAGTVAVALISYSLFTETLRMEILIGNAISWIFATMFAFLTNRKWVFVSHKKGVLAFFQQMFSFFMGRFVTLILEEWMLMYFVGILGLPNMLIKVLAQFVIIATNYVISKLVVFRRKPSKRHNRRG